MPLTILSIAYPFAPVGPHAVGGAEQILGELDRALTSAGHLSLVAACEGSQPTGTLFSAPLPGQRLSDGDRRWARVQFQAAIDRALATNRVDLIHMHGLDFYEYRLPTHIPVLVTLHLPVAWYPQEVWTKCAANVHFQCVSKNQWTSCPPELKGVSIIENGVALPARVAEKRGDFALALGRICPEKNMHQALEAGTLAGIRVLLGGHVFPYESHMEYFRGKVEPLLEKVTGAGHAFLGALLPDRKQQLLAQAKCLLHPTLAPETSSLVAMEALVAGTPVIAYRSGALPAIVEEGVTGFLVDSAEEMAAAVGRVHTISSDACRRAARLRFSRERMVREYFHHYNALIGAAQSEKLYA